MHLLQRIFHHRDTESTKKIGKKVIEVKKTKIEETQLKNEYGLRLRVAQHVYLDCMANSDFFLPILFYSLYFSVVLCVSVVKRFRADN